MVGLAVSLGLYSPACIDDRCGDGQKLSQGRCWPILDGAADSTSESDLAVDAGQDATLDAGNNKELGQEAGADLAVDAGLGVSCDSSAGCKGPADYCAKQPGQAKGYCTFKGCDPKADTCPTGYYCLDLTLFDPKLPTFCAPKKP